MKQQAESEEDRNNKRGLGTKPLPPQDDKRRVMILVVLVFIVVVVVVQMFILLFVVGVVGGVNVVYL